MSLHHGSILALNLLCKGLIQFSFVTLSPLRPDCSTHPPALYDGKDWVIDRTSLNVSWVGEKEGERMGGPLNFVGQFAIKKRKSIIGGVQWRAQCALNPLPTKWPTVYLRGQIGQTVSNYPSIEGKVFFSCLFFFFFFKKTSFSFLCVWESSIVPTHQPAVSVDLVLLWTQGALEGTGLTHCLLSPGPCRTGDINIFT